MKILAISLLRLGDIFMHQEILRDLRQSNPKAKIDLVINEQFRMVQPLLHEANNIHFFPRQYLQQELVEPAGSFFRSYIELRGWIGQINLENYDLILDLSHTFISHKLLATFKAKEKRGSVSGYFNDVFSSTKSTSFQYVEALRTAVNITNPQKPRVVETRKNKVIAVQPLTSDQKKNWSLRSFQKMIEVLSAEHLDHQIIILGAPFEEVILRENFSESERVKIEILSLQELEFQLWQCGLLISGDTATVHLAALCRTPVIGLYVGSADPYKTAPWMEGAVVIHSQEACAPCKHSDACSQSSHLCGESLNPVEVAEAVSIYLNAGISGLQFEAAHYPFAIYCQASNGQNGLVLEDLASLEQSVRALVRQAAWGQVFRNEKTYSVDHILTKFVKDAVDLVVHVKDELAAARALEEVLNEIQKWTRGVSRQLLSNAVSVDEGNEDLVDLTQMISEWRRMSADEDTSSLLQSLELDFTTQNSFAFYKNARWTLGLVSQFLAHKIQIYETLKNQLRERGYNYVSGPGKLS